MEFLILASVSLFVIACSYWITTRRRLPPSPWGLPLIGHLHLIGSAPHKSLYSLANKLGPIMSINFGLVPAVVLSNARIVQEVYKSHDVLLTSRPFLLFGEYVSYNFKGVAFGPDDHHWKTLRKLCTMELFTEARLQSYLWVRLEELSLVFSTLFEAHANKQPVHMREVFTTFTFNVMTQIVISARYFGTGKEDKAEAKEFKHLMEEAIRLILGFHPTEFCPPSVRPIVKRFDWSIPQFMKVRDTLDKFLDKIIKEHLDVKSTSSPPDFMDILLKEFADDDHRLKTVKANVMEMLVAGTDSSALTSEWVLAELLQNPHIMKKAQEEIDQVVGKDRMVQEADFPKLEYLKAIIKETLRLHPTAPLLLPRLCGKDFKAGGYNIPKGASVMVNVYAMGRDENVWKNATIFYPERFMGSPIQFQGQHFEFIPFGTGRRVCPGKLLALKTIQLIVGNLIHGFDWSLPNDGTTHVQTLDDTYSSVSMLKSPLRAVAVPRLPPQTYSVL